MHMDNFFFEFFKTKAQHTYFSPGRVNLIGEHIDYNGGLVFPAAISLGTYASLKARNDRVISLISMNFKEQGLITISLDDLTYNDKDNWANYVKGVIDLLIKKGYQINHGFDLAIYGTLPPASGLSSSASLLLLITFIMSDIFKIKISRTDMALYAQDVENNYMGMHCGIMDQLIIAKGVKDKALLMDTKTYETEAVNAFFKDYTWVIMNTNYQRKTTDSKYNERVSECQQALKIIKNYKDVSYLCDLSLTDFSEVKKHLTSDLLLRRARHTVFEQQRVLDAKAAMERQDALHFSKLLNESHESLKNDFEVTGLQLDELVIGARLAGASGARVTGAGFGGCAIALVPNHVVEGFNAKTNQYYKEKTKLEASFYQVDFVDGVNKLDLESVSQ